MRGTALRADGQAFPVVEDQSWCRPEPLTGGLSDEAVSSRAELFKALADPHRVRILGLLAAAGTSACVCDLKGVLGLSQPTVTHHMQRLLKAGLLDREQRGVWAYYSINSTAMNRLGRAVHFTEDL